MVERWDLCKLRNENCIVVDGDEDFLSMAFMEPEKGVVGLDSIPRQNNGLELIEHCGNEATALIKLFRPKVYDERTAGKLLVRRMDQLYLRHDHSKTCTFDCLHMVPYFNKENPNSDPFQRRVSAFVLTGSARAEVSLRELEENYCIARPSTRTSTTLLSMRLLKM